MHRDLQRSRWALGRSRVHSPALSVEEADVLERAWAEVRPAEPSSGRSGDEVKFKPSEAAHGASHPGSRARPKGERHMASTITGGNQGTFADRRPQDAGPPRHDLPERLRSLA